MKLKSCVIVIIVIIQNVIAGDNLKKKVEELENEKNELYNQINAAIEDSLKVLKRSNDSESITGLNYMKELKKHITKFNATDKDSDIGIDADSKSYLENRRKFSFQEMINPKKAKDNRDPFNFEAALKPKKTSEVEWKKILENRIKVQTKLDDWILQRQKERDRLNEYRHQKKRLIMSGQYEKCPRFGYGGSAKNLIDGKKEKNKNKNSKKVKYPCCRKCCKKSYMGCL